MSCYKNEIDSLDKEIKRMNAHLKKLREQKREAQRHLCDYMERHQLEKFDNITLKSIQPKERRKAKPKSQRKQEAIDLFYQIGIPDPQGFWNEFQTTQRNL